MELFTFGVKERGTGRHLGRVWVGAETAAKASSYAVDWVNAEGYDLEGDCREAKNVGYVDPPDGYVSFNPPSMALSVLHRQSRSCRVRFDLSRIGVRIGQWRRVRGRR